MAETIAAMKACNRKIPFRLVVESGKLIGVLHMLDAFKSWLISMANQRIMQPMSLHKARRRTEVSDAFEGSARNHLLNSLRSDNITEFINDGAVVLEF